MREWRHDPEGVEAVRKARDEGKFTTEEFEDWVAGRITDLELANAPIKRGALIEVWSVWDGNAYVERCRDEVDDAYLAGIPISYRVVPASSN